MMATTLPTPPPRVARGGGLHRITLRTAPLKSHLPAVRGVEALRAATLQQFHLSFVRQRRLDGRRGLPCLEDRLPGGRPGAGDAGRTAAVSYGPLCVLVLPRWGGKRGGHMFLRIIRSICELDIDSHRMRIGRSKTACPESIHLRYLFAFLCHKLHRLNGWGYAREKLAWFPRVVGGTNCRWEQVVRGTASAIIKIIFGALSKGCR